MSTSGSAMGNMMSGDAFFSGGSMQSNASVMPTKKLSYKERLTKHLTELSVIQRTLNQDPGTKPSIRGVVSVTIRRIELNKHLSNIQALGVSAAVENRTTVKKTNVIHLSTNVQITKHIPVIVPRNRKHPYNLVKVSLVANDENAVGSCAFNLHDVISIRASEGVYQIWDEFSSVANISLEITFNYGMFGYGFSDRLEEDKTMDLALDESFSYSLFPRILTRPEESTDIGTFDFVKNGKRPDFIPFKNEVHLDPLDGDLSTQYSDEKNSKYTPTCLMSSMRDITIYRDQYVEIHDRMSKILSLNHYLASRYLATTSSNSDGGQSKKIRSFQNEVILVPLSNMMMKKQ